MPKLPVVGDVPKGWLYAVGGGTVLVLGYVWWKHKHPSGAAAGSTAAPAGTTDQFPPDGTTGNPSDPYSTDPATGMTYGDEQLYGGGSFFGGGPGPGGGPGGGPGPTGGPPFANNALWAQYAQQQLTGIVDPAALSAALGAYLVGMPVSPDQVSLIDQARAIAGDPPVAGPGGFPPSIRQQPGGGGGKITGLTVTAKFDNVSARWNPVTGASSYQVQVTAHQGSQVLGSATASTSSATVGGLPQKTAIAVHVTAQPGGQSAVAYTSTK